MPPQFQLCLRLQQPERFVCGRRAAGDSEEVWQSRESFHSGEESRGCHSDYPTPVYTKVTRRYRPVSPTASIPKYRIKGYASGSLHVTNSNKGLFVSETFHEHVMPPTAIMSKALRLGDARRVPVFSFPLPFSDRVRL